MILNCKKKKASDYDLLNDVVYGIIAGVKIPFPIKDSNICNKGVY